MKASRSYFYILPICIAAMFVIAGCEAQTRYQVLSFFFDGVPAPEDQVTGEVHPGAEGQAAKSEGGTKHGPYAARMCTACHDQNTNTLLLPKTELCFKCHILNTGRRQHGPVAAGGCLVCHDPHRSANPYMLVAPPRQFCLYCHDPQDIFSRDVHKDNTMSCTDCHNPHGSDNEYFLR